MSLETLAVIALTLAAIPAGLFLWNLWLVQTPQAASVTAHSSRLPAISVLIPARNEAANIGGALESVLQNEGVELEVIVLDDASTDGTGGMVASYAERDARVVLRQAPALPPGWCGKQHACHVLAGLAQHPLLVFLDADVRLAPDALPRMASFMEESGAALASGVPRQITETFFERLLIPLVHFVLLGFLPVWRMRRCAKPAYAAGCGQLFICDARTYWQCGGHAAIRATLHDGIKLPRTFRRAGFRTDLFDATDVASCRMYAGSKEVFAGLAKNATEGLAAPTMIVPMTAFLLIGQVLPWGMLALAPLLSAKALALSAVAAGLTVLPRLLAAWRFRQSWVGAMLHPVAIVTFVSIQWLAFLNKLEGRPSLWKGREYFQEADGDRGGRHVIADARKAVSAKQGGIG